MILLKKDNILIFIILIFLFLFLSIFQFYIHKQKTYEELSNNLYSNNASSLKITKNTESLDFNNNNYRIFLEKNNTFKYVLKNVGDWSPPLISGNFFKKDARQAVVGQEMKNRIINKQNNKYITYEGQNYKVVGIMGASFPSSIDYLILLNEPNIELSDENKIVIDSEKKSIVKKIVNYIKIKDKTASVIENFQRGLLRTGKLNDLSIFLLVEVYVLCLICFIFIIRYWYEREKKTINTLYILGISSKKIFIELFKISLYFLILSYFTALIILSCFLNFNFFYFKEAIISLSTIILINFFEISFFIYKSYRTNKRGVKES
ncbi:ABC transporter permease [Paenibacillus nicotianae]|uniref:ABC transporter permease n=1 Tax=Paenibacillus nicotianae TaxID=1526551 RepID=A0ABW4UP71_9BACL